MTESIQKEEKVEKEFELIEKNDRNKGNHIIFLVLYDILDFVGRIDCAIVDVNFSRSSWLLPEDPPFSLWLFFWFLSKLGEGIV